MSTRYWLLKAEPDSRIVNGKDVKFSATDFERVQTSPWEGVRNYEARNLMKEMQVGEKAVFYHSNCKTPGIAAFAEVAKEAYPDYTAWDSSHPYYDPKSDEAKPKWYMVDLKFTARAKHFIPLALLRFIADATADNLPEEIKYIGEDGVTAIKNMDLVARGRLSVQRVEANAWNTIQLLAENGGWEEMNLKPPKKSRASNALAKAPKKTTTNVGKKQAKPGFTGEERGDSSLSPLDSNTDEEHHIKLTARGSGRTASRKRKSPSDKVATNSDPPRRSRRRRVAN